MAATIDILPTIAAICHTKLPQQKIDGVNILSLLKNEPENEPRLNLPTITNETAWKPCEKANGN
jgi:hypothetical protein